MTQRQNIVESIVHVSYRHPAASRITLGTGIVDITTQEVGRTFS